MTVTLYGIRNCDTMKTARAWLDAHGVGYAVHDYKTAGIERARIERWVDALGWTALLNRSGTTFRRLADADRADLDRPDRARDHAIALMLAQPAMIRRPVIETGTALLVGFAPARYAETFGQS